MNYFLTRGGQQYGPYTLADLQRFLSQGNIRPDDLARSEAMEQWVPVQQIVGNIAVPQAPVAAPNYGQVPAYGQAAASWPASSAGPLPPELHWTLVLLFTLLTCGIFGWIWMFVQASFGKKLRGNNTPLLLHAIGIAGMIAGEAIAVASDPGASPMGMLLVFGCCIVTIVGHFKLKGELEEYYSSVEKIDLQLSGVMTFFFNVIYFQYHMNQIRNMKQSAAGQAVRSLV